MGIETQDTDLEVFITTDVPGFAIEVFVKDDQTYQLGQDYTRISSIRQQVEKSYGVPKVGDVTLNLKNDDHKFTNNHASSIFNDKQVINNWVRIRSGWGAAFDNAIETQFQGKIKLLETTEARNARMILYDSLQDTLDVTVSKAVNAATNGTLTINSDKVPTMAVIDVLEYLIDTEFGLQWLNLDTLVESSLLDATDLAAAKLAASQIMVGTTTWDAGSKLIELLGDLMKLAGGLLYSGKDGKLHVKIFAPTLTVTGDKSFTGDEDTDTARQILVSRRKFDLSTIVNRVDWSYGQSGTKYSNIDIDDSDSITKYGTRTKDITMKWELSSAGVSTLDHAAQKLFSRQAEPPAEYQLDISWLMNGDGLAVDLGDIITIADPAQNLTAELVEIRSIEAKLREQKTIFNGIDATALQGKFFFFPSEVDQGDGRGVTAFNFQENWRRRFWFFGNADATDPHTTGAAPGFDLIGNVNGVIDPTFERVEDWGKLDSWGNGIEENFIFW